MLLESAFCFQRTCVPFFFFFFARLVLRYYYSVAAYNSFCLKTTEVYDYPAVSVAQRSQWAQLSLLPRVSQG